MFSFCISIDGNKELHDSCRKDFSGQGSYDRAIAAVRHYRKHYNQEITSKMTLSPENISYTFEAVVNLINEGYDEVFLNCVFEEGWTWYHANILYTEMVKLADYIIDNDLYNKIYISLFEEIFFKPMDEEDNNNWCGGVDNRMFALSPDGGYYSCIRYMESSLNGKQKPLILGNINEGYLVTEEHKTINKELQNITRRSQSTDECYYCPVGYGCAWCSGLNYELFGTVNKRATYICVMHKARALANVYYWNKLYKKCNIDKEFVNYLSQEDINQILQGGE
jgi:radical SAM peptide maturase (CXXX-repeat target family)